MKRLLSLFRGELVLTEAMMEWPDLDKARWARKQCRLAGMVPHRKGVRHG
jgi:hypothetical protein